MNRVIRSRGIETLAGTCEEAVFNPDVALGIIKIPGLNKLDPEQVQDELDLDGLTEHLNQRWQATGYLGRLSTFKHTMNIVNAVPPHIDAMNTDGHQRAVVLSVATRGTARVSVATFGPAIMPGDTSADIQEIGRMRGALEDNSISYSTALHHPSEILVIPTLPNPTAHGTEIMSRQRSTALWESAFIKKS